MKTSRKRQLLALFICALGFVLNLIAYYPGFLSPDSIDQYRQSLSGIYTDWHPPIMSFLWRQLNRIHQGPGVMLAFQLACFWLSVYYLLVSIKNRIWQILVVLFAFMPFVQNFAGYIIKDTHMAMPWLLGFAIIFRAIINGRKLQLAEALASALLLLYGTWVRFNALSGLLPMTILWAYAVFPAYTWKRKWLLGAALTFIIAAGQVVFIKIVQPQKGYVENKFFLHDLLGIFVKTGENVFPAFVYENPDFDTAYLRKNYHPATLDDVWWNPEGKILLRVNNDSTSAQLKSAWISEIRQHPDIYLKNRMEGFLYFLRIRNRKDNFMYHFRWMQPNDMGLTFEENRLTTILMTPVESQKNMPYMRPWFWFLLNVILCACIPLIKTTRFRLSFAALTVSSLFYLLPSFLIFSVDTDFRYFYWNCLACTIALFILFAGIFSWGRNTVSN